MVEHNYGKGSMCLSKSSSFYLEHSKQLESDLAAVAGVGHHHDLAATPTGSPDDEDEENGLKRKQSASSLFFKFQEQENTPCQQQTNPIFRIGASAENADEDDEDEDENYARDYNSRLSEGLKIGEEFLLDSRMLSIGINSNNNSSAKLNSANSNQLNHTVTAMSIETVTRPQQIQPATTAASTTPAIYMNVVKTVNSQSDLSDDQALSSTLKETKMIISSSSCSSSSGSETNISRTMSTKKKSTNGNRNRRRHKKRESQGFISSTASVASNHNSNLVEINNKPTGLRVNSLGVELADANDKTLQAESNQSPSNVNNNFFDDNDHQFEFFEDDDLSSAAALHQNQQNMQQQQVLASVDDQLEQDYFAMPIGCDAAEDEDSSGADYFLASSVDTVINAPYLTSRFNNKQPHQQSMLTNPVSIPTSIGYQSQTSQGSYASSYTKSVAKNFLGNNDNKMNVNSTNNASGSYQNKSNNLYNKHHDFNSQQSIPSIAGSTTASTTIKGKKTNLIKSLKKLVKKNIENRPRWNKYF